MEEYNNQLRLVMEVFIIVYDNLSDIPTRYINSITEAIDIILSYSLNELETIILFGSCARLNLHVGSDIDIAIVTKNSITDRSVRGGLRSDLETLSTGIDCDLTLMTTEIMNMMENNRLRDNIKKDGIILWEGGKFTDDYKQLLRYCYK